MHRANYKQILSIIYALLQVCTSFLSAKDLDIDGYLETVFREEYYNNLYIPDIEAILELKGKIKIDSKLLSCHFKLEAISSKRIAYLEEGFARLKFPSKIKMDLGYMKSLFGVEMKYKKRVAYLPYGDQLVKFIDDVELRTEQIAIRLSNSRKSRLSWDSMAFYQLLEHGGVASNIYFRLNEKWQKRLSYTCFWEKLIEENRKIYALFSTAGALSIKFEPCKFSSRLSFAGGSNPVYNKNEIFYNEQKSMFLGIQYISSYTINVQRRYLTKIKPVISIGYIYPQFNKNNANLQQLLCGLSFYIRPKFQLYSFGDSQVEDNNNNWERIYYLCLGARLDF